MYDAGTWTPRKVKQKYMEAFEIWCWRRKQMMSWTEYVRNGEMLQRVQEEGNILQKLKKKKRKAYWIGHILFRNCLLKHVIEGKVEGWTEVRRRRGKRRKQLLGEREDAVN